MKKYDNRVDEKDISITLELSDDKRKFFFSVSMIISLIVCFFSLLFVLFKYRIYFKYDKASYIVDVFDSFEVPSVKACYGNMFVCKDIDVTINNSLDSSVIGDYSIEYKASYKKKNESFVVNVSVVDREAPIIDSPDNLSVCPNDSEYSVSYKASDNYDGDVTSNVVKSVIGDNLILSVVDSSNNFFGKVISLVREDVLAPVISLNGNDNVYILVNTNYSDPGYSAIDNCDGDITSNVIISGSVDSSRVGTYKLDYSVTDSIGNSSTVSRNVHVYAPSGNGNSVIYLTFDDGPSAYTGELLDILARYNVKATFFVTNRNPGYNYFIKRAYDEGHTIALHTSSHNYSYVYSSVDAYFNDLGAINETVKNITGSYSNLIRFPGGSSNTVSRNYSIGIMSTLSRMVTERGYKYFDWNVSSSDADGYSHPSSYYSTNIINGLGSRSYYIVLQHDTNINSIRSVGTVIEYGLSHGYSFRALDINSPTVHHGINN
jgi:peptidoglycan/xylan/chitin deacetylase (PgdA/CDA1 family)